jgi:hypothetical protein
MDLLCIPESPSFSADKTPYVCQKEYDGGPFLTYAHRERKTRSLPPILVEDAVPTPYLEVLHPTPQEEQERFYQTGLFFGLLAEFLSLNRQRDDTYLIPSSEAESGLSLLYKKHVVLVHGKQYLKASNIPDYGSLFVQRIKESKASFNDRLSHFRDCLRFAHVMLNSIHTEFDDSIRYSIAALGELLSVTLNSLIGILKLEIEAKMLGSGWCPSEVERARFTYHGLNTLHMLSHMERSHPKRNHLNCTNEQCQAFQIDLRSYELAHARPDCKCSEVKVYMKTLLSILERTDSYPLLRITVPEVGEEGVQISVEEYKQDVPYVALSHVSTFHMLYLSLLNAGYLCLYRFGQTDLAIRKETPYRAVRLLDSPGRVVFDSDLIDKNRF